MEEYRRQRIEKYYKVSAWGLSEILGFNIFRKLSKVHIFNNKRIKISNGSSITYEVNQEPFGLITSEIIVNNPIPGTRSTYIEIYFDEPLRCNDYFQTIFQVFDDYGKIRKIKKLINNELN